jgi:hypothetical protein
LRKGRNGEGITPTTVCGRPFNSIARPTIVASPPNRRCQKSYASTTTSLRVWWFSASVNVRPSIGATPSSGKNSLVTFSTPTSSGSSPPPVRLARVDAIAAIRSNVRVRSVQRTKFAGLTVLVRFPVRGSVSQTTTRRSGAGYGNRSRSAALTIVKIAVLAPMPSARAITAIAVKAGVRNDSRRA